MKCRVCEGTQQPSKTDLPFKTIDRSIIILKSLPVLQCKQCGECSMDDPTFRRMEEILSRIDSAAELTIVPFAT